MVFVFLIVDYVYLSVTFLSVNIFIASSSNLDLLLHSCISSRHHQFTVAGGSQRDQHTSYHHTAYHNYTPGPHTGDPEEHEENNRYLP